MRVPHIATATQKSVFTARSLVAPHRDALAAVLIGASLITSGYLVSSRELTKTQTVISEGASVSASTPGSTRSARRAPLNLNTATAAELDALPRIGPALAGRIVGYRTAHGAFTSVDELDQISGIGPTILEALRPLVTAP